MNKDSLGARLKHARKLRGLNQETLQNISGIKQSTISKIERGVQKTSTEVPVLAHALSVSALWLSGGQGVMEEAMKAESTPRSIFEEDVMLFQYFDPRCLCGPNVSIDGKPLFTAISVSQRTMNEIGLDQSSAIAFIQSDDSGGSTLSVGDQGVINASQRDPVAFNGRLFAIAMGDTVVVRRITIRTIGGCLLASESQDKARFPDESLSSEDMQRLNIIGRLCWSSGVK